ncbi:MAG: glycosyltransferase family 4 protein [Gammaproteobacteria bacterium]|nr:glycosyltransferase family 4 protein [Gammaproteobacteria bacterium]MCP5424703.1 glycosyltransferase family 4 protein [Gammaproteobacteria bacterium]
MTGAKPLLAAAPVRLALITTHPIQYQIPWFKRLARIPGIDLRVFFGMLPDAEQQGVDFGVAFQWDIPLLEGFSWTVLRNVAKAPSLGTFKGISTPQIGQVLRAWKPDVAIAAGWQSHMLVQTLWACRRLRIPLLVRGDSNALAPRPWWKRMLHRLWLKQYSFFLAVGKANRRFYLQAGIDPKKIFHCPHFVDNEWLGTMARAWRQDRDMLRQQWGISATAICLLYVGKLVAKKRIMDLLEALDKAARRDPRLHLLIVGAGQLEAQAREFSTTRHLPASFAGFLNQTEIAKAYVVADCLVLPSDFGETWGLVVNEAMACGLPAIVSDRVGCGPDLVEEGNTGALFPFGDVDALASTLGALTSEAEHLRGMGRNAQERVLRDYSIEKAVEGTVAAINAALPVRRN